MSLRRLEYIGGSQHDINAFPVRVRSQIAHALRVAQRGYRYIDASDLDHFPDGSVIELQFPDSIDIYDVTYTSRFPGRVYVLCAFSWDATTGTILPPHCLSMIASHLDVAADLHTRRRT